MTIKRLVLLVNLIALTISVVLITGAPGGLWQFPGEHSLLPPIVAVLVYGCGYFLFKMGRLWMQHLAYTDYQ